MKYLLSVFVLFSSYSAQAAFVCFHAGSTVGGLTINNQFVEINYDVRTNVAVNILRGHTQSYRSRGGTITAKAFLSSPVSDGFPATVILTKDEVIIKENDRVLSRHDVIDCPRRR